MPGPYRIDRYLVRAEGECSFNVFQNNSFKPIELNTEIIGGYVGILKFASVLVHPILSH